jgi:hypothetical protein
MGQGCLAAGRGSDDSSLQKRGPHVTEDTMATTTDIESVPLTWVDERDVAFFRCVVHVFPPMFLAGASVLLASNDADIALVARTANPADPTPVHAQAALQ